jgi:hypothetical protein
MRVVRGGIFSGGRGSPEKIHVLESDRSLAVPGLRIHMHGQNDISILDGRNSAGSGHRIGGNLRQLTITWQIDDQRAAIIGTNLPYRAIVLIGIQFGIDYWRYRSRDNLSSLRVRTGSVRLAVSQEIPNATKHVASQ